MICSIVLYQCNSYSCTNIGRETAWCKSTPFMVNTNFTDLIFVIVSYFYVLFSPHFLLVMLQERYFHFHFCTLYIWKNKHLPQYFRTYVTVCGGPFSLQSATSSLPRTVHHGCVQLLTSCGTERYNRWESVHYLFYGSSLRRLVRTYANTYVCTCVRECVQFIFVFFLLSHLSSLFLF